MKKKIYVMLLLLVSVMIVSNAVVYAISRKSIIDFFFDNKNEYIANDLLEQDGQSYDIDNYTIKLEESLYENRTQLGYLVFSISKKKGKPEADINDAKQCKAFGEGNRFTFDFLMSGNADSRFVYVDNVLFAYISFSAADFPDEFSDENIALIDYQNGDDKQENGYRTYNFKLNSQDRSKTYKITNGEMCISSLGIKILSDKKLGDIEIKFIEENGKEKVVVDTKNNIGTSSSGERGRHELGKPAEIIYTFVFEELIDISKLRKVSLKGEKLEILK